MDGWGNPLNLAGSGPRAIIKVRALDDGVVSVKPSGVIKRGDYTRYMGACKEVGCDYDATNKRWTCPPALTRKIVRELQAVVLHVKV